MNMSLYALDMCEGGIALDAVTISELFLEQSASIVETGLQFISRFNLSNIALRAKHYVCQLRASLPYFLPTSANSANGLTLVLSSNLNPRRIEENTVQSDKATHKMDAKSRYRYIRGSTGRLLVVSHVSQNESSIL